MSPYRNETCTYASETAHETHLVISVQIPLIQLLAVAMLFIAVTRYFVRRRRE